MVLIELDRHYIKVLSYLSVSVTCPILSHTNVLLVPHLVCLPYMLASRVRVLKIWIWFSNGILNVIIQYIL